MIADEVQTGFGRTGKWFTMENFDVEADMTVMSKSIAAGLPLSAVSGRSEIMDSPEVKELGGTLGGNPLSCVAAINVIKMIEEQNLLDRSNLIGDQIRNRLTFHSEYVGEVRGIGAMVAIEFVKDKNSKEPFPAFVQNVVRRCQEKGVILITAGPNGNIIRLLPPLVISEDELTLSLK
ncbi:aminotransferase class III-fold pyridoxal phosphate-dependent enzyme [Bacillus sp. S/N-304-OC-R1]|nr:aminotransferase class III-fold pyridoxal phosphate-dependent enzyme [Bacillus sp. S/N-304-OC-R1]